MRVPASLAAAAACFVLVVSGASVLPATGASAAAADRDGGSALSPEVARTASGLEKGDTARVVVTFEAPGGTGKRPDAAAIREARADVLADLPKGGYDVVSTFSRIPAVSLEADQATLDALAEDPQVLSVQEDHVVETTMAEANALTGTNDVHAMGITGNGLTVAVIDSGVDSNAGVVHTGLADDLVAQACFRTENDCINGPTSAEDQNGHGTHVAGTITGPQGVAPNAQFYALKVFTTGSTSDTNILNALNHVIGLNTTTPGTVDLVNMSLGSSNYATQAACNAANSAYQTAFATLNSQSVTNFVATGNDADIAGVGAPGCVSGAVGVGSTGDAAFTATFSACTDNGQPDKVTCFSNATPVQGDGELVDLLAPGCRITSTWLDNGTNTICGTSMATPYAAGVGALVQEYAEAHDGKLSPSALEALLEESGKPITDYRITSSPAYPRVAPLDAIGALALGTPSALQVTATTATTVSLSWTGVPAAASYRVTRVAESSGTTTELASPGTGTTFTDSAAPCGPLTYTVRALDGDGLASQPSNQVSTTSRACPATPGNVTLAENDVDTHTIAWTLSGTFTNVVLQRRQAGGAFTDFQFLGGSALNYEDTVATCGRVDYRVLTVAANGDRSAPSSVVGRSMCAPLNDDLADAEVVAVGGTGTTVTDTEPNAKYASVEDGDPAYSCHFGGAAKGFDGVWYQITPAADSRVTVSTATSTITDPGVGAPDTLVAIYKGTPAVANEVACNDDISGSNFRSTAVSNLLSGNTYWVHVSQWTDVPDNGTGNLITTFTWAAPIFPPANDDVANAAVVSPLPYTLSVPNAQLATVQATDPLHPAGCIVGQAAGRVGTHTLWWTFTPDVGGTLDLDTLTSSGSFNDTILSVFTGSPGSFVNVACDDDAGGGVFQSQLDDVVVTGGTTYNILLSRWSTTPTTTAGTAVLHAAFSATPGVTLSQSAVAVEEGRPGATYTARLNTQPPGNVSVTPTGDADCSVSAPLTFTAANWATPQTVTVTAPDDGSVEATEQCSISHVLSSADPAYDGLSVASVTGTVTDKLTTAIALTTPAEGASYVQGTAVAADFACSDNRLGAGITSCVGTVADGAAVDTSTLGSKSFTVTLTDVHGGTTTETNSYTVTAATVPPVAAGRPDARISSPAPLVGDNVYGGSSQKKKVKSAVGTKVTYVVSVQNDSTAADTVKVKGGAKADGFKVKYLAPDGSNITAAVVAGTFVTPSLAPGATYDIMVVVKVGKKAGKKLKTPVTVTSVRTPAASDVVTLFTKRK